MSVAAPAQTIFNEIRQHIADQGGPRRGWYAGIASHTDRLFVDHGVPRQDHWFIFRRARSAADARAIEKALLDWGCDGGPGGGDGDTVIVYAYLKTSITNP